MEPSGVSHLPWSDKNMFQRFVSPLYFYFVFGPIVGLYDLFMRFTVHVVKGQKLRPENFLPLLELVLFHYVQTNFGNCPVEESYSSLTLWLTMHVTCSTWFIALGTTAAHHHPGLATCAFFLITQTRFLKQAIKSISLKVLEEGLEK